ncbi:MFS transporter [Streptobacillus moniliformis]|uniref:Na+/melibiose symporter and related transporter-like protein n=2 Tax=Streptobacillus moniliformis TaxID=34105 RepID=D1AVJ9_STRM9|nr:MFS transporter [Streptobacillus moniliformis]ACZ01759.1 Na+/melibiose symporter and related transporter- like protein [Streptobacillus moniliformis DSM 12112]AVL43245.1 glucuronide permease [Streptobacillus moniliformis]QXW65092.1 MFS transporter [Streptobacillus moniliformis]SQA13054.1 Thiomethylgalactoside permease II [Streptobacillus moniliformis]
MENIKYNRAKIWQIALFSLNNTATNIFFALTFYLGYFATGFMGVATVFISNILTTMRIFDGITDPLVGYLIDRTNGKFGKFRPYMIMGNIIMAITMTLIYIVTPTLPENMRFPFFLVVYVIYILGYTCQTAVTKAGQACITNDPKQRPLFSSFEGGYTLVFLSLILPTYVNGYLLPKYGNAFTLELFREFVFTFMFASAILTILSVIGIYQKDRLEFFGTGEVKSNIKFRDYVDIIKNNRAIQTLIVAASTDKIALTTAGNAAVGIMVYGIIMGDNTLQSKLALITIIPAFILLQYFAQYSRKLGIRKGMITTAWGAIITYMLLFLLFQFGDPTKISANNLFGFETLAFIALWCIGRGLIGASGGLTINAIADCSDYETYRTGKYVPGMMGTLFSFVDKIISSISTTIIGVVIAMIGYTNGFPKIGDVNTPQLFYAAMFLFLGLPILGWIASVISLKFYPLTAEKMEEIQKHISDLKNSKR